VLRIPHIIHLCFLVAFSRSCFRPHYLIGALCRTRSGRCTAELRALEEEKRCLGGPCARIRASGLGALNSALVQGFCTKMPALGIEPANSVSAYCSTRAEPRRLTSRPYRLTLGGLLVILF